jgi:hypothetical protein
MFSRLVQMELCIFVTKRTHVFMDSKLVFEKWFSNDVSLFNGFDRFVQITCSCETAQRWGLKQNYISLVQVLHTGIIWHFNNGS